MFPSIQVGRVRVKGGNHAVSVALVAAMFGLSACASVPDAINPVAWYDWAIGGTPNDTADDVADADSDPVLSDAPNAAGKSGRQVADGLVDDTENSNYAPAVPREVTATKPLVRTAPTAAQAQMIAAAQATPQQPTTPAAPTATTDAGTAARTARADLAPQAPPATAPNMVPPGRPDIPDQVTPARKNALMDHYQQRLMESASQTAPAVAASAHDGASRVAGGYGYSYAQPIHLTPPNSGSNSGKEAKFERAMGERNAGLSVTAADGSSSFLLATLDFQNGGASLSPSDIESLRDVARQYRKTGGVVRILGLGAGQRRPSRTVVISAEGGNAAASATPMGRAEATSAELVRLGVPASKILVGAVAPGTPAAVDGAAARVYLDM